MDPVEAILLVVLGLGVGAYSAAVGAGGGFLVAPILLIRYPDAPPAEVTAASLIIVFVTSATQSLLAARERRIDTALVGAMLAVAIPASLLGGLATTFVPRTAFALGFALLIVAIAVYVLLRPVAGIAPPSQARVWRRERTDSDGNRFVYRIPIWQSVGPTAGTTFLAAMAGIGGGPIGIPMMTRVMRIPHAIAVPSMHFLILFQSASVVAFHVWSGNYGDPLQDIPWLAAGVLAAAPVGRWLRRVLGEGILMRALALGMFIIAARTAIGAFQ
ncbi:MAG: sulfite exporter TauE/SafE family protein [Chloroflexi bacterium]|nr:sulfite exporter TauE/SafE family protein [Chloroflexota bacterium]